jgi:F0F1-type ATP synthase membrane subunit b/b'
VLEKQIVEEAHVQSESIIEKGKYEVESLRESMMKDVRSEAVQLAVAMTKRLTSAVLSSGDQHMLITKELKKLESVQRT